MIRRALLIEVGGLRLAGTLHCPVGQARRVGVLFVTGGMQIRAGSQRSAVQMAQHFAKNGFASMRFDLPGLGDSEGYVRDFDANSDCLSAAIDTLLEHSPGVDQVLLWGLCDGASAAALYSNNDNRVTGLFLVNPWAHTEQVHAQTMVTGYYRQRLVSSDFWRKLVRGKVGVWRGVREYVGNWLRARETSGESGETLPVRLMHALGQFQGYLQIVIAGQDLTGQAFLQVVLGQQRFPLRVIDDADHTFSSEAARAQLLSLSTAVLERISE